MRVPDSTDLVDRLEESLGPDLRFSLGQLLELHGIPPELRDAWWEIPSFRVFVTGAVCREARRLQATRGWSRERALAEAAVVLDVPHETVRSRLRRAWDAAYPV